MINFIFKGHKISIRNDDWRKLKERFDPENAIRNYRKFSIERPCPFCKRFEGQCENCPVSSHNNGTGMFCTEIACSFFRKPKFLLGIGFIGWYAENDRQARRQLKAILRRMEKIEANQKSEKEVCNRT